MSDSDNPWTVPIPDDPESRRILAQVLAEGLAKGEIEERDGAYRLTPKGRRWTEQALRETGP